MDPSITTQSLAATTHTAMLSPAVPPALPTLPKLKLTLKLSGSNTSNGSSGAGSGKNTSPVKPHPSQLNVVGKSEASSSAKSTPFKKPPKKRPAPDDSRISNHPQVSGPPPPPVSQPTTAPRQSLVHESRNFKVRRWQFGPVQVETLGGYSFAVPSWIHEAPERPAIRESSTITDSKTTGPTTILPQIPHQTSQTLPPTFVCPHEGCHQIFDTRLKWRRHQYNHTKRERRAKQRILGDADPEAASLASTVQRPAIKLNLGPRTASMEDEKK